MSAGPTDVGGKHRSKILFIINDIPRRGGEAKCKLFQVAGVKRVLTFRAIHGCESIAEASPPLCTVVNGSEGKGEGPLYTNVQVLEKIMFCHPLLGMPLLLYVSGGDNVLLTNNIMHNDQFFLHRQVSNW